MSKQKVLTEELINASSAYYAGNPVMSDIEFDRKIEELKKMEKESGIIFPGSPTLNVGAEVVSELKKARHEQSALSLDKVKYKDRESLKKWLEGKQAVMSWKCDGSTVVLTYDNGTLTQAVTRGNGEEGSVITHNARFFKGVPRSIPYRGHLVVRGEAMMTNAEFESVNAEAGGIYENARNLATATIQMLDANESRKREIIFKAFELVTPEPQARIENIPYGDGQNASFSLMYMQDRLNMLEALGFAVVEHECCDSSDILQKIEEWKEDVQNLPFPTDGLVISYQDLIEGWALGSTGHHPRWAMALKWSDETVETVVRDIEWSVGKTGIITPVAVFDPVRLGLGSTVTRASLHNLSIMENMPSMNGTGTCRCGKGSKVKVYLANLIIPQIACCTEAEDVCRECREYCAEGNISPACYVDDERCDCDPEPTVPEVCPVCGADTEIMENNGVKTLHCPNHDECPAQQVGKLMNTFSKDGLFVKGLGESQIEDLLNAGLVTTHPLSFYRLQETVDKDTNFGVAYLRLLDQDGWGPKKWDNLIDAINASRKTTLQKFLYGLNIPLLGNDLSKKLSKFWSGDVKEFIAFTQLVRDNPSEALHALLELDGIGDEKANNVVKWIEKTVSCREVYEDFISLIDELDFPEVKNSTDETLKGLTFVITGSVHEYKNRDEFKASVEARGGKVAGSVSKNTTALVNNDLESTSGKNQKAKELGVEIISEDDFISRYGK